MFQNSPMRPPGASTDAALAGPTAGSTQCHAWPATTRSNTRSRSHCSNDPSSTMVPRWRATAAIRRSGSTPTTSQPPIGEELGDRQVPQTDVEDPAWSIGDEGVDQGGRVRRPSPVVPLGVGPERLGSPAVLVEHRPIMPPGAASSVLPGQPGAISAPC